jgi:glycosyltransferase involved in cell wall biosynthesis
MKKIVVEYDIGLTVNQADINEIRNKLRVMLYDEDRRKIWISNTSKAKKVLNWENEQKKLISLYKEAGLTFPE